MPQPLTTDNADIVTCTDKISLLKNCVCVCGEGGAQSEQFVDGGIMDSSFQWYPLETADVIVVFIVLFVC